MFFEATIVRTANRMIWEASQIAVWACQILLIALEYLINCANSDDQLK